MIHESSFDFHVDPKHFNFIYTEPMYIHVKYSALKQNSEIGIVCKVNADMYLISAIVLQNNWVQVDKEIREAAQHNAELYMNNPVDRIIMDAIAPHINY